MIRTRHSAQQGRVAATAIAIALLLAGCVRHNAPAPVMSAVGGRPAAPPLATNIGLAARPDSIIVQPGETLYAISRRYAVPLRSLIEANNLQPPFGLVSGRRLMLPQVRTYTVQQGDTLLGLSRRYGVDASTLARTNEIAAPYPVKLGQVLILPPATEPQAARPEPQAARPEPAHTGRGFAWPVRGPVLVGYGPGANGTQNDGINIAAPLGTPVLAANDGVVAYAGNELRGFGNLILLKHADGWTTAYAHCQSIAVKRGERVKRGQVIAHVGATGAVAEPQLHFELRRGTRALDPQSYLPPVSTASAG
jgi:murein DD-endopeptidase MepM/ murein hydrolase activator NlpD